MKLNRRALLLGATAVAACAQTKYIQAAPQGLNDLAAAKGLTYGAMVTWKRWDGDNGLSAGDAFEQLIEHECGLVVSAMEIFWGLNSQGQGSFDFSGADQMVAWSQQHGKKLRGHNLIWHEQTPSWFKGIRDRAYAEKKLVEHVTSLCSRYAGKMQSWDVVNEVLDPRESDGLRRSVFYKLLGPAFLDTAFHAARAADPKALLVINDYAIEYNTDHDQRKRQALLNLLDGFKQRGTPIDAVGIQSHLYINRQDTFDQSLFANFLKEISDRGLQIMLTEMDVVDVGAPGDIAARDAAVAAVYKNYLDAALASPALKDVITWGLSDHDSWIVHTNEPDFHRDDGLTPRPLPFDADLKPKPAYFAIADALKAAPSR